MIRAARDAAGTSQKVLAKELAVDQTQLSAWERGRRSVQDRRTLERIANALKLSADGLEDLVWAMNHDRVIASTVRSDLPEAARLVSLALQASHVLSQDETRGLERRVAELIDGKRQLPQLVAPQSKES